MSESESYVRLYIPIAEAIRELVEYGGKSEEDATLGITFALSCGQFGYRATGQSGNGWYGDKLNVDADEVNPKDSSVRARPRKPILAGLYAGGREHITLLEIERIPFLRIYSYDFVKNPFPRHDSHLLLVDAEKKMPVEPTESAAEAVGSRPSRGAPEQYDWGGMWVEIVFRYASNLPSQSALVAEVQEWFRQSTGGRAPAQSTLNSKLAPLYRKYRNSNN